jgi:hypothetical protein
MNKTTNLKNIAFIVLLVTMFSCKQSNEEIKTEEPISVINTTETFEYKLKNEPKFFLKFWENMTEEEYHKVINVLQTDGKINGFGRYVVGTEEIEMEPIKDSKSGNIIGLTLLDFSETFYNLFKEKYNLKSLATKNQFFEGYIEENPCYLHIDCDKKLSRGKFIQNADKEKLSSLFNVNFERFDKKILQEDYKEITTKTSNIIISHTDTGAYKSELNLDVDYDPKYVYFYYSENKIEDSQKRAVIRVSDDIIYIQYFATNYFEKREKEKKDNLIKTRKDDEKMKTKINQVKNDL